MTTAQEVLADVAPYLCNLDDFQLVKKIGEGAFGIVYLAIHKQSGIKCAVKKLITDELEGQDLVYFCREVKILACCHSYFLVPLLGFTYTSPYLIVTEFIECGTLFNALHHKSGSPVLSNTEKDVIAMCIAHGMMNLHKMKIIHRDLKSLNILLDNRHLPRIIDFGIARFKDDSTNLVTQQIGTTQWMAPEQMMTATYTNKVDVYAYGILLWEIVAEDVPFRGFNSVQIAIQVAERNSRPRIPESCPKKLKQLIELCWHRDPERRPSFKQIFNSFASHKVEFPGTDQKYVDDIVNYVKQIEQAKYGDMYEPLSTRKTITQDQLQQIDIQTRKQFGLPPPIETPNLPVPTGGLQSTQNQNNQDSLKNPIAPLMPSTANFGAQQNQQINNESSDDSEEEEEIHEYHNNIFSQLTEINKNNVINFYTSIKENFEFSPSLKKRKISIQAISQLAETDQELIPPLTDVHIFEQLPYDNSDLFPLISKIISAMIAAKPSAISPDLSQRIALMADKHTAEVLHLFSKFALIANKHKLAFQIISPFLAVSSSYLNRGFTQDFIRVLVYLLKINSIFADEYKTYTSDLIKHILKCGNPDDITFVYNALISLGDLIQPVPPDVIEAHLKSELFVKPLLFYFVKGKPKVTGDVINYLIQVAPTNQLVQSALCSIAESPSGAVLILMNKSWLDYGYDTITAIKVFLSVLAVPEMRPALIELDGVAELFLRVAMPNIPEYLILISSIFTRLSITASFIEKLSVSAFTSTYLQLTVVTSRADLVHAGLLVGSEIAKVGFSQELITLSQVVSHFVINQCEATERSLITAAILIGYPECKQAMIDAGINNGIRQCVVSQQVEPLKQELISKLESI